ncbi:MAG: HAD-IIIC family phosphatase [Candidatus Omnitrophota bacterium]
MTFEFAFLNRKKRRDFWQSHRKPLVEKKDLPDYRKKYYQASLMVWEEHCVECSPPDCYKSCLLYEPGVTVDCRRFEYGIFRDNNCPGLLGFGAEIYFKRWAKLEAVYAPTLFPLAYLKVIQAGYHFLVGQVKTSSYLRDFLFKRHLYPRFKMLQTSFFFWFNHLNAKKKIKDQYPDAFILDVINLEEGLIDIHISFTEKTKQENRSKYDRTFRLKPGFNHHQIDYREIALALGDINECFISLTIVNDQEAALEFAALDFVKIRDNKQRQVNRRPDKRDIQEKRAKVKCLVFDLDNTLWDGTLLTDGRLGIQLKPAAKKTLEVLDKRGILFSIASKNNFKPAQAVLAEIKMDEYFLFPQIHWGLKSESIRRIAQNLNIGIDTIGFIDDSPFELAEVSSALPEVRCYNAAEISQLIDYAEFDVMITEEAVKRRKYYRLQQSFEQSEQNWQEERIDFLKSCQMTLVVSTPNQEQLERCYELLQRTNQLNLSARRYSRSEFEDFLADNRFECFILRFKDKFGEYGIIGVAVVKIDVPVPQLIELAISCRVARRKVEQTFVSWLANRYQQKGFTEFLISMRCTNRNDLLKHAFEELNFRSKALPDDYIEWRIALTVGLFKQDIITLIEK